MESVEQDSVRVFCAIVIVPCSFDFVISHMLIVGTKVVKVSSFCAKQKIISGQPQNKFQMLENEELMVKLLEEKNLSYAIEIEGKSYDLQSVSIIKSQIPVRKPTTRGGVYFTDTMAYKIKGITHDLSIKKEIPKLMLGPNTDFKPILFKTRMRLDNVEHLVTLTTHLTNVVNTKDAVELNLIVDKIDLK